MKPLKIAVGTAYEQKINYLKEVLKELKIEAQIYPFKVESGVSDQPITSKETLKGSLNRARRALEAMPEADMGIGIEVGYDKNKKGDYEMFCWTTIHDRKGESLSSRSFKIVLPQYHQDILKNNLFLNSDRVRKFVDDAKTPDEEKLGILIRERKGFIMEAIIFALRKFFKNTRFDPRSPKVISL